MPTEFDADRYYTPLSVARKAMESARLSEAPVLCADTACGAGRLLSAAEDIWRTQYCLGIDNDPAAIRKLRRERPNWRLIVGDLLKRHRPPPLDFPASVAEVDLLVLNPPFSLGSRKYITVKYRKKEVRCSVAMAHMLRSLELFQPRLGALAVVPESLLYSETDNNARELLAQEFAISTLLQLSMYTFKGARVNSSFVQLKGPGSRPKVQLSSARSFDCIPASVVRGGLQMHSFDRCKEGVPVVHSTSLKVIAQNGLGELGEKTVVEAKGRLRGWLILLPRGGLPSKDALKAIYAGIDLQLSDCVIGLKFSKKSSAYHAEQRILANWQALSDLYRGTGARYITIDRLENWLCSIGICDEAGMEEITKINVRS